MIDGHAELVRSLFDTKAATWPVKYRPGGPLVPRLASFLEAVTASGPAGGRVLDIGCGTGELARSLAAGGMTVTGCDISATMLAAAAAADPARTVAWVALAPRWRHLPFTNGAFDVVVAASVLEYTTAPALVLRECARVLRPGGVMACTVPNLRHPVRWLEWIARAIPQHPAATLGRRWRRWESYHTYLRVSEQRHTARWWRAAAERAGLRAAPVALGGGKGGPLRLLLLTSPGSADIPSGNDLSSLGNK